MTPARIRISRVKMKGGGVDVRVLLRAPESHVSSHMRAYVGKVLSHDRPPDAYAAVSFWYDPERPGLPSYHVSFCTTHDAITQPVLVQAAAAYLVSEQAAWSGECKAVEAMGGEIEPWSPDEAS